MAGLDPAICRSTSAGGDGRVKPGHDGKTAVQKFEAMLLPQIVENNRRAR
jgi:hypothetical protein